MGCSSDRFEVVASACKMKGGDGSGGEAVAKAEAVIGFRLSRPRARSTDLVNLLRISQARCVHQCLNRVGRRQECRFRNIKI